MALKTALDGGGLWVEGELQFQTCCSKCIISRRSLIKFAAFASQQQLQLQFPSTNTKKCFRWQQSRKQQQLVPPTTHFSQQHFIRKSSEALPALLLTSLFTFTIPFPLPSLTAISIAEPVPIHAPMQMAKPTTPTPASYRPHPELVLTAFELSSHCCCCCCYCRCHCRLN